MSQATTQRYDDLNTSKLIMVAILGVTITLASVIWLHAMYSVQESAIQQERNSETPAKVREVKEAWAKSLNAWGPANQDKQITPVPITRAIDAVIQDLQVR